jgi:hypothetical protein
MSSIIRCGEPLPNLETFQDLEQYLREFVNFHGDPAPYDFSGSAALMLASLNNLREKALSAELESLPESLTDDEALFILQLADGVRRHGGTG